MNNYFLGIAILFFSTILTLFVKSSKQKLRIISIGAVLASFFTVYNAVDVMLSGTQEIVINLGSFFQNLRFAIDKLSAFFIIFISIMTTLAIIYANGYLKPYIEKGKDITTHCIFLPMLLISMLGVVVCQNALMFLVVWELMSLSSFFLVIFENNKKEVLDAGIKYLVYMHISVIFIILCFILLSIKASSLDFLSFKAVLMNNVPFANIIFILAFFGFGIKAGFIPFHNWLPAAHPAAPSHVSGIMSGVMIKTGIYGILRVLTFISTPSVEISYFVLIISVLSALYGVLYAIAQHDLKKLLAYHSIENIAIIGIGVGIGMLGLAYNNSIVAILGFAGGILHILNHSIFKELLFLAAGSVYNKTHTRDIEILGGLVKSMPKTSVLFLVGSVAICGLPPFNGFVSEFLIYFGLLKGLSIENIGCLMGCLFGLAGLALVGTMAILCFTKVFSIVFLGESRSDNAQNVSKDTSIYFILPMSILAVFTLLIGLFPKQIFAFLTLPVSVFVPISEIASIVNLMQTISYTFFFMIIAIFVLYILKKILYKNHEKSCTWGCGYNKPNSNMQYSASSYASPFIKMATPLFVKITDVKKPKSIFPTDAHYSTRVEDIEESYLLQPIIRFTEKFLEQFEKIQNGNIQYYISFGLIFLLLAVVGVVILG